MTPFEPAESVPIRIILYLLDGYVAVGWPKPTPKTAYYALPEGVVQVSPRRGEACEQWHFRAGPLAGRHGRGTVALLLALGRARRPADARALLAPFVFVSTSERSAR